MSDNYSASKKLALKTIIILAVITVVEVLVALTGKGYIVEGLHFPWYLMGFAMICMSLYKAYLIVGEFMHLKHEVRSMAMSVVLPTLLLIWAIIAFMYEGGAWKGNRDTVDQRDEMEVQPTIKPHGMLLDDISTKHIG